MNYRSNELRMNCLDEKRFTRTWAALRQAHAEGVAPGFVAGFWTQTDSEQISVAALGERRTHPDTLPRLPMLEETVFDLASLTKVMGTATLAALLVDRGWLRWNAPLEAYLPEVIASGVTVAHLLSHTAGYVAWQPLWERMRERFAGQPLESVTVSMRQKAMRDFVSQIRPDVKPGERVVYSDISFLLLGFVLEEVAQLPLDEAISKWVWSPMGLETATFRRVTCDPAHGRDDLCAATEICNWRGGVLQGQVHDDNCWAMGGYAGHAGAFGSIRDVLQFARALVGGPGRPGFLSPEVRQSMWNTVSSPVGCGRTLGWDTPTDQNSSVGERFSRNSVGHLGFTGTSLWIDRDAGLAVSLLSNRVHPSRENPKLKAFRPVFHDALRTDLSLLG